MDEQATSRRQAVSADWPGQVITTPNGAVMVRRTGVGRPVLCLHAVGHGSGDFAPLAQRLGQHFEFIAIDWPGHGASPADLGPDGPGAVEPGRYAEILLAVMDALALQRPLAIGNSIGGAALIIAAAKAPERFLGVVLCNPGGLAPVDALARRVTALMADFFRAGARGAAWFGPAFALYYRLCVLGGRSGPQRRRILAAGREIAPLLADAWARFGRADADLRARAATLTPPVWLAWARRDQFVSLARSRAAAQAIPHHEATLFPALHAPFLERPMAFAKAFRAWADRI